MNNSKRTPEEKAAQRAAARTKRRERFGPAVLLRYTDARAVACDIMGIRYKPVVCPRSASQLDSATAPTPGMVDKTTKLFTPNSWEMLTEQNR